MRILVFAYRNGQDCSNHGVSARNENMWMFYDCTVDEALAECEKYNLNPKEQLILNNRVLCGEPHPYAEPLVKPKNTAQTFGGNFVYTSDSRMPKVGNLHVPIPVHDRFETWSDFEAMSI